MKKGLNAEAFFEFGSPTRTRTTDILINSQTLYQLSYRGSVGHHQVRAAILVQPQSEVKPPAPV